MSAQGSKERANSACAQFGLARTPVCRWTRLVSALRRAEAGVSAVEFALAAPILVALTLGIIDLGLAYSAQIRVQQAAQAGAQYALVHGFDSTSISSAVTSATALSVSASPAPSQTCGCVSSGNVTLSGSSPCTNTCANGLTAGTYVKVFASYTYHPLVPYASVLSNPTTLSSQALVRVE